MMKTLEPVLVKKASGEFEAFNPQKLQRSLEKAGADDDLINQIGKNIGDWMHEGVTTNQIYSRAFSILRKTKTKASFQYKLKQAILQFGITGYPFEQLVGQIFSAEGYQVEVGVMANGKCIRHEIDVIATRDNEQHLVECKFSNSRQKQIRIQTPLYVQSRMQDVIAQRREQPEYKDFTFTSWLVSNIRFTTDSMDYSKCAGLHLLSWSYPDGAGLKERIEGANIYPITLLNYLKTSEKRQLIDKGIVVCNQLYDNHHLLDELRLSAKKMESLMQELRVLCE